MNFAVASCGVSVEVELFLVKLFIFGLCSLILDVITGQDRKQQTLIKSPLLRRADGLSFGPDGYVYISDSDIPDIMMRTKAHIKQSAPFYIFRFQSGQQSVAGQ